MVDLAHEFIADLHGVIAVLPRDSLISFAVNIAVIAHLGESHDLILFFSFPGDEIFNLGMINIEADHLGRTASGASGFDGPGIAVKTFKETHETGGLAAAGKSLAFRANGRKVGSGTRTTLKEFGFSHIVVGDRTLAEQRVFNGKDKAGRSLSARVAVLAHHRFIFFGIPVPELRAMAGNTIAAL